LRRSDDASRVAAWFLSFAAIGYFRIAPAKSVKPNE